MQIAGYFWAPGWWRSLLSRRRQKGACGGRANSGSPTKALEVLTPQNLHHLSQSFWVCAVCCIAFGRGNDADAHQRLVQWLSSSPALQKPEVPRFRGTLTIARIGGLDGPGRVRPRRRRMGAGSVGCVRPVARGRPRVDSPVDADLRSDAPPAPVTTAYNRVRCTYKTVMSRVMSHRVPMTERRGFTRFADFNQFLLDLYRRRPSGQTIADL